MHILNLGTSTDCHMQTLKRWIACQTVCSGKETFGRISAAFAETLGNGVMAFGWYYIVFNVVRLKWLTLGSILLKNLV